MDAITIQILRNKISSLVEEMHYHFYRSGYSTIIRESRDFYCVILDRDGRLIVAPPMFFHAPVYRYLVGSILKLYPGDAIKRRRRVRLQPSLRRRHAACLRHGVRRAGLRRRQDRRVLGLDRPQGRRRRHGAGLDLGQPRPRCSTKACWCRRSRSGRPGAAARHRAHHPDQHPPAGADARRHPCPDRGDADGRRARQGIVRAVRRHDADRRFRGDPARARPTSCGPPSPSCRRAPHRPKAISTATASRSSAPSSSPSRSRSRMALAHFDFSQERRAGQGPGQPAAADGRGLRVLFADRQPRPRTCISTTACATWCASSTARAPSSTPSRRRRCRTIRWSICCSPT